MSEDSEQIHEIGNPYKIVDNSREYRKGIMACSLQELIKKARIRFSFPDDAKLTVVLEQDGTEVDDEEYFATLEKNANLMILNGNQKWTADGTEKHTSHLIVVDDIDHSNKNKSLIRSTNLKMHQVEMESIVSSLCKMSSPIPLLTETHLEMLSDMDPNSVADIVSDRLFLEQLKEASDRFLLEKRQAQESMALLQILSTNVEMEQT